MSEKVCETAVSRCKFGLTKLWQLQERNQKGLIWNDLQVSERKIVKPRQVIGFFWGGWGNPSGCLLIFCSRSLRSRGVLKNPEGNVVKKKHGTSWNIVSIFWGDVMKCVGIGVILMSSDFRDQSDRSKDPTTDENFPTTTQSAFVFFQVDFLRSITHPLLSEFVSWEKKKNRKIEGIPFFFWLKKMCLIYNGVWGYVGYVHMRYFQDEKGLDNSTPSQGSGPSLLTKTASYKSI